MNRRTKLTAILLTEGLPGLEAKGSAAYLARMLDRSEAWYEDLRKAGSIAGTRLAWDAPSEIAELAGRGETEEATWLAFVTTMIGRGSRPQPFEWVRELYSGFGDQRLGWARISDDPGAVDRLFDDNPLVVAKLKFGNHRKYESRGQIPAVVRSYLAAVQRYGNGSQKAWFSTVPGSAGQRFSALLPQVQQVRQFGRLGSYDFLVLLSETRVYSLEPERIYLEGATGPLHGARRLFGSDTRSPLDLDMMATKLTRKLGISLAAMEDALCNWQKRY